MSQYAKFLRKHLLDNHTTDFAITALASTASSERVFHYFTEKENTLITLDGYTLAIQPFPDGQHTETRDIPSPKDHYIEITQKAIDAIDADTLEKVVLARTKVLEGVTAESLIGWYERLLEKYPAALVFIVSTKTTGIWIGASPELLAKKAGTDFHTIALAATSESVDPCWSEKDYDEHAKVVTYLTNKFKRPEIKNLALTKPHTAQYGMLSHLKTDVSFTSTMSLQNIVDIIHPTPALCGFPKDAALAFIQENEAEPRSFYTGSMTIESPHGDGVSYAFLRCARLLHDSHLTLFAGCGIVSASIPQKEWDESEAKILSILNFL